MMPITLDSRALHRPEAGRANLEHNRPASAPCPPSQSEHSIDARIVVLGRFEPAGTVQKSSRFPLPFSVGCPIAIARRSSALDRHHRQVAHESTFVIYILFLGLHIDQTPMPPLSAETQPKRSREDRLRELERERELYARSRPSITLDTPRDLRQDGSSAKPLSGLALNAPTPSYGRLDEAASWRETGILFIRLFLSAAALSPRSGAL
ncbi:uncharacterized protein BJ171DRAFT_92208 [Polychytrium aggregatum]|uniref:uncharacterized protein n=1 Tax=Polychytrium aggregatum TaxID=110093 RepID=UPI0022FF0433|nr:uncharacterized protein BJ171DRAFT_92208 [Polychytrium aggregatum]KAI9204952.1 hypothetical protein BJ171DRAFT_92208 [Polychytrium aggregatum]